MYFTKMDDHPIMHFQGKILKHGIAIELFIKIIKIIGNLKVML